MHITIFKSLNKRLRPIPLRWPRNGVVLIQMICLVFKALHDLAFRVIYALSRTLLPDWSSHCPLKSF